MLLKAPLFVGISLTVTLGLWLGVMLAGYGTGSRSLISRSIWDIAILALEPIGLAAATSR
jgi:hypothetical protein